MLKDVGVSRYHCNLETAPSFFTELCSTHTIKEKKQTLLTAKECGLDICSGGIIGMGETVEQRIELACELRSLGVKSVPINILNPIKGTALENAVPLSDEEILTTIAIFRFILPDAFIRFAGGRIKMSEELQLMALQTGINASIVGDLLTTINSSIETDYEMFRKIGYKKKKKKIMVNAIIKLSPYINFSACARKFCCIRMKVLLRTYRDFFAYVRKFCRVRTQILLHTE
jgi:biotin synthase